MSSLPSLCHNTSSKNQQPLELPVPDQNQDTNSILPSIFIHPQLKAIPPLSLTSQNPSIKMPQSGKRMISTPRSSRQFPPRASAVISTNASVNPALSQANLDSGISVSQTLKPSPPLNSHRKRNGNARRYKNKTNIILPPLEDANTIDNIQSDPFLQDNPNEQRPFFPTDVGDVYMGSGNDLSDELEEEDDDDDEMFLRMNSGRIENASNRADDGIDNGGNKFYAFHIGEPKFSE